MGSGASTASPVDVKASIAAASEEELKTAFAALSVVEKAKVIAALTNKELPVTTGMPEDMLKQLKFRQKWDSNSATFSAWLAQTNEDVIEPEMVIIDPHHHIWDMRQLQGYNMFGLFKQQYYMSDELVDDFIGGGHNITSSVFVTTHAFFKADANPAWMAPLGEVQFVQGIAAQFASGAYGKFHAAAGIVGSADLLKYGAEVEPLFVACKAASPNYRGIRCNAAHDPNLENGNFAGPGMYSDPKFREGFALLEKYELVFDAWIFSCQLGELYDLAKAFPSTTIVLNHQGTPLAALGNIADAPEYDGKQADILAKWREGMAALATDCSNVIVKVGAMALPNVGHGLDKRDKPPTSEEVAELFKETYLWTIKTFGASRCMFEGNFPVDKVCMSYTVLWNAYKRMTKDAGMSEDDRALLFSGTAKRVYKL